MGLGTDLASARALQTSLGTDGASSAIGADATHLVIDLSAQVSALSADLATAQTLKTSLTADGANATVLADVSALITDLTAFLS